MTLTQCECYVEGLLSSPTSANWKDFSDLNGIQYYEVSLGTSIGTTDIVDWVNVGLNTVFIFNNLPCFPIYLK